MTKETLGKPVLSFSGDGLMLLTGDLATGDLESSLLLQFGYFLPSLGLVFRQIGAPNIRSACYEQLVTRLKQI